MLAAAELSELMDTQKQKQHYIPDLPATAGQSLVDRFFYVLPTMDA